MGNSKDERKLSILDLVIKPLGTSPPAPHFSCGDEALDGFLGRGEAAEIEREDLGRTYLAFHDGDLAAYFTVSVAEIRIEYLAGWAPSARMAAKGLEAIPALKVGRLAVVGRFQGRGVGVTLVRHAGGLGVAAGRSAGVRLLMVQAKPESVGFYARLGFQLATATRRERARRNRTMFVDLREVASAGR